MNDHETMSSQQMYMSAALWVCGAIFGLPALVWSVFDLPASVLWNLIGFQVYALGPLIAFWISTNDPAKTVLLSLPVILGLIAIPLLEHYYFWGISKGKLAALYLCSLFVTYKLYQRLK